MSSSHHAQVHVTRRSPPNVRKVYVKAPPPVPSSKAPVTPKITIKVAKSTKHPKDDEDDTFQDDEDDDIASSFLQFCAMCEKQILVPNSSILYCSESCRRRDSVVPTTNPYLSLASPTKMVPSAYSDDIDDPFGSKIPTYVAAMQPTPRPTSDARIPPVAHNGKSDLDPTEWKPAEPILTETKSPPSPKAGEWKPKLPHRPSSEAFSYLSKFHRSSDSLYSKRRPALNHGRSTISSRTTPSLSHTPTASTSSEESLSGTPYEFVARPALSMPTTTASHCRDGGKLAQVEEHDLTYEKKFVGTSLGSATGSLKKLLRTGEN
ncbi:hypothetical protein HO173_007127 [Letharia columbiana]|uniref:Life-span regulatory factor-domain-containing protein n=1 Tax=Letharia columbiana TaxID=112416 RepID=A0A8H6FTI7_9LECA|nr:uncharacterized protein HO173_007127 [Letharia columbiana]KAF6234502.1 hypothetical protein HO173_007127 [Letharia columbiana]